MNNFNNFNYNQFKISQDKLCAKHIIYSQVANSFMEDLLIYPDITSSLITNTAIRTAYIKTNQTMTLCGSDWLTIAFMMHSTSTVKITWYFAEGEVIEAQQNICKIEAIATDLLIAERVALNFIQFLSGTATLVAQYVDKIADTNTQLMDTRKTIPNLRFAQKYAVIVGGGVNQRIGLYDGILIKENHIIANSGLKNTLKVLNQKILDTSIKSFSIQVEVETFEELVHALDAGVELVLLDNMSCELVAKCVQYVQQHNYTSVQLEASGGIDLNNIRNYALTGVHRISIGSITKHLTAIDLSMRLIAQ